MFFKNIHKRERIVLLIVILCFIIIIGKVFYIQVIDYNKLSNLAAAKVDIIFDIGEYYFIKYPSNKYKNGCHLTVYSRLFFNNPLAEFIQTSLHSPPHLKKVCKGKTCAIPPGRISNTY